VAVGDFNRDGKLDLAVALNKVNGTATGTEVSVLLGNGDGTFQRAAGYSIPGSPSSVVIGDFDRDGRLDIAVPDYGDGAATVLLQMLTGIDLLSTGCACSCSSREF
jgi:hypothetical protein